MNKTKTNGKKKVTKLMPIIKMRKIYVHHVTIVMAHFFLMYFPFIFLLSSVGLIEMRKIENLKRNNKETISECKRIWSSFKILPIQILEFLKSTSL
jgi:hypothetical protein